MTWLNRWRALRTENTRIPTGLHTIKDVVAACGLPGPVVTQLVPRTWVEGVGWLFTAEQLQASMIIADDWRRELTADRSRGVVDGP